MAVDDTPETPDLHVVPSPAAQKADSPGQGESPEPEESSPLSFAETQFVEMSASGAPLDEMAAELHVCARTLRRWRKRPDVASAIKARMSENMSQARAVLAATAARVARQLADLAENGEPDSVKVAACRAVIENATALETVEEIESRLLELEARQASKPGHTGFNRRGRMV